MACNASTDSCVELKTVIVGDSDVGKTSLCLRFCHGKVTPVNPTIGASFLQKRVEMQEGCDDGPRTTTQVVLQLWDTAGQERFRSMSPMYFRNAKAALIVFDASKEYSVQKLSRWRQDLLAYADQGVVIALVGNKCDVRTDDGPSLAAAQEFAESVGAPFYETSAYTGVGVEDAFMGVAEGALRLHRTATAEQAAAAQAERLRLDAERAKRNASCC
ncbi:P-loop containing nucleoside triphosphate hydrolase protein [Tribonema minus]|uniref:P-loop containing nucleoside triphosphate hydrolase protein n=1 Tax=Tribonema minus TaxID=303371 RepID=A0A835Z763_9STRA|nr:P-loop containing nucleoside triphosphate hydrolase protein [Tribonema minus]